MYWKFSLTVPQDICGTCSLYFFPQINDTTFKVASMPHASEFSNVEFQILPLSFAGRAFRHGIKSAFSSGVSTPEDSNRDVSVNCRSLGGPLSVWAAEISPALCAQPLLPS